MTNLTLLIVVNALIIDFRDLSLRKWLLHEAPVALNVVTRYATLRISTRSGAGVVRLPVLSSVSKAA